MFFKTLRFPLSASLLAMLATLLATLLLLRLATVKAEGLTECTVEDRSSSSLSTDSSCSSRELRSGLRPSLPATLLGTDGPGGGDMWLRLGSARTALDEMAAPKPWLESCG